MRWPPSGSVNKSPRRSMNSPRCSYARCISYTHAAKKRSTRTASNTPSEPMISLPGFTRLRRLCTLPGTAEVRLTQVLAAFQPDPLHVLDQCAEHHAYAGNNYYPFLLRYYRSQRALFFHFLHHVTLFSTSQDRRSKRPLPSCVTHQETKEPELTDIAHLTLTWIPDKWWPLVTGRTRRTACVHESRQTLL